MPNLRGLCLIDKESKWEEVQSKHFNWEWSREVVIEVNINNAPKSLSYIIIK
jgi:hypothetical protein